MCSAYNSIHFLHIDNHHLFFDLFATQTSQESPMYVSKKILSFNNTLNFSQKSSHCNVSIKISKVRAYHWCAHFVRSKNNYMFLMWLPPVWVKVEIVVLKNCNGYHAFKIIYGAVISRTKNSKTCSMIVRPRTLMIENTGNVANVLLKYSNWRKSKCPHEQTSWPRSSLVQ